MTAFIDLKGQTFGRLLVVSRAPNHKRGWARWNCRCSCPDATETVVNAADLRNGHTQSCGCHSRENTIARSTKHGSGKRGGKTRTYRIWVGMRERCLNPNKSAWKDYGGRGIGVCERWNDFANFLTDMGECPPGLTLERVDNNRGYSPDNCIWADRKTQNRNRRDTTFIMMDKESRLFIELCEEFGLSYGAMRQRQHRAKRPLTQADFEQAKQQLRPAPEGYSP